MSLHYHRPVLRYRCPPPRSAQYRPHGKKLISNKQEIIHMWMKEDLSADQIALRLNICIDKVVPVILKHERGNADAVRRLGGLNAKSDKRDSA